MNANEQKIEAFRDSIKLLESEISRLQLQMKNDKPETQEYNPPEYKPEYEVGKIYTLYGGQQCYIGAHPHPDSSEKAVPNYSRKYNNIIHILTLQEENGEIKHVFISKDPNKLTVGSDSPLTKVREVEGNHFLSRMWVKKLIE